MRVCALLACWVVLGIASFTSFLAGAASPVTALRPQELGRIMVLEYHRLGEPEGLWYRSEASFRNDLESLYRRGYRPITVQQLERGRIDVPAGLSPVVLTMDDSTLNQFYFLEGTRVIDPHTMVGIWEAFRQSHPDWRNGATWCVLPGAKHPSDFWGERPAAGITAAERKARIRDKLEFLVSRGHEICGHTLWHATLSRYDDAAVQRQIADGERKILELLPGYRVTTFALPLGQWPKRRELAWRGCHEGHCYDHEAVLLVSGGPSPSPFSRQFEPHAIPRIIVAPGALEHWLDYFDAHPEQRFISDGNPATVTFPAPQGADLDPARLGARKAQRY